MRTMLKCMLVGVLILAATSMAGCAASQPDGAPLTRLADPGDEVPVLTIRGEPLVPAQYSWFVDGAWNERLVTNESEVVMNQVPLDGDELVFALEVAAPPSELLIQMFSGVDERGLPAGQAKLLDCFASTDCTLSVELNRTLVRVSVSTESVIVTVMASYIHPADAENPRDQAAPFPLTASWALQVRQHE